MTPKAHSLLLHMKRALGDIFQALAKNHSAILSCTNPFYQESVKFYNAWLLLINT